MKSSRNDPKTKKETADRILRAADEVLASEGFEGASVRAVAERAGVNKALVFYYFGSKAELFDRVLERYYRAHLEALEGAFAGEGTPRERFHRVIDAYLDFMRDNRRYPQLIQQTLAAGSVDEELVRKNLEPLYAWTVRTLGEVLPPTGPTAPRQLFLTFAGMVTQYFTHAPVLGPLWGDDAAGDPLSAAALAERRAHVQWMVDTVLDAVEREAESADRV